MPSASVSLMMYVALSPGITYHDLAKRVRLSLSSVWRAVDEFSVRRHDGSAGLGLFVTEECAYDSRLRVVVLSPKGRQLMEEMCDAMDEVGMFY
jgi:DNA-binding MarR family transcriptional regulator